MNRRHSANPTARRPLRSSPLAGPALSSEGFAFGDDIAQPKPSRMSSTPELGSLSLQPPSLNRSRRPSSHQGLAPVSAPPSPSLQGLTLSGTTDVSKRASFLSLGRNKSKRQKKSRPHTEGPPVPSPPVPEWALQQISPIHILRTNSTTESETSTPTCGRAQSRHNLVDPTNHLFPPPHNLPRASSHDSTENWLTTNTYDTTPRFSRLGLASTNVVLPVSVREHRRLSRASSRMSMLSFVSGSGSQMTQGNRSYSAGTLVGMGDNSSTLGSQSLPSLSLTRTSSNASSKDGSSKNSVIFTPSHSLAPSVASLDEFSESEKVGEGGKVLTQKGKARVHSDAIAGSGIGRRRSLRKLGWSMKNMSLRSSESKTDIHSQGPSFLSFGADEMHDMGVPVGMATTGSALTLELTVDHSSMTAADKERGGAPSQKPKKSGTIRRLWRTLSSVGRKPE